MIEPGHLFKLIVADWKRNNSFIFELTLQNAGKSESGFTAHRRNQPDGEISSESYQFATGADNNCRANRNRCCNSSN